jgi:hypothetical protein
MKERAIIVIFELEEKEGREKNRAEVMELTVGRDGEHSAVISSSDKMGHAQRILYRFAATKNRRVSNIGIIF